MKSDLVLEDVFHVVEPERGGPLAVALVPVRIVVEVAWVDIDGISKRNVIKSDPYLEQTGDLWKRELKPYSDGMFGLKTRI